MPEFIFNSYVVHRYEVVIAAETYAAATITLSQMTIADYEATESMDTYVDEIVDEQGEPVEWGE